MKRGSKRFLGGMMAVIFLLAVPGQAVESRRVAVLEFRNPAGLPEEQRDYLVDAVVRGAVRKALPADRYLVMNKENMIALLEEQKIRLEQACEGECELDVGRKIGAHYIVTGSFWKVGAALKVTIKLHETKSGNLLSQETVSGADLAGLGDPLEEAARGMMGALVRTALAPGGPTFVPAAPGTQGPSEAQVTEVAPTQKPTAATGPAGLFITTDPAGAEVYLGDIRAGTTSPLFQKLDLEPGSTVRVTLKKSEYHDKGFEVALKTGVTKYEGVKLDPAFGTLAIDSKPPGARVTIGGAEVGTTPYRNERMGSGRHLVSLALDLHRSVANEVVEVRDGEVTSKSYVLEAEFGTVSVDSEPRGARVLVGSKEMGKTPVELRLSPGEYEVVLDLEGYRGRNYDVKVTRGSRGEIPGGKAVLERKVFSVMVSAEPAEPGAAIWLDGQDTGKMAPETITGITEGTHSVEVRAEGKAGKQEVSGADGEAKSATVALQAIQGAQAKVSSLSGTGTRFTVSEEGVITDSQTALEWYVGPDKDTTWDNAVSWVKRLSIAGGGWRMPTRAELETLSQKRGFMKTKIDPVFIRKMEKGDFVWSGETRAPSSAWAFYFSAGGEYCSLRSYSLGARAFAVRSRR